MHRSPTRHRPAARLLAAVAGATLGITALAGTAGASSTSPAPADVQPYLADQLAAADAATVVDVLVHGTDVAAASSFDEGTGTRDGQSATTPRGGTRATRARGRTSRPPVRTSSRPAARRCRSA